VARRDVRRVDGAPRLTRRISINLHHRAMPFDVVVTISGLFVWAVDRKDGKVHVLTPKDAHGVHDDHAAPDGGRAARERGPVRHFARVVYDSAYERPDKKHPTRDLRCVKLEGRALELPRGADGAADPTVPTELIDLNDVAAAPPLPRRLVRGAPSESVGSRITFAGGRRTYAVLGPDATFRGMEFRTTTSVDWTIRGVERLRDPVFESPQNESGELHPIGGVVRLFLYHAPRAELEKINPGGPTVSDPDAHFEMFFDLWRFEGSTYEPPDGDFRTKNVVAHKGGCKFGVGDGDVDTRREDLVDTPNGPVRVLRVTVHGVEYTLPTRPLVVTYGAEGDRLGATCGEGYTALADE
jgi:hypothetical protein